MFLRAAEPQGQGPEFILTDLRDLRRDGLLTLDFIYFVLLRRDSAACQIVSATPCPLDRRGLLGWPQ
jgi:hypothetical protein